jgi:hypothetical protein
LPWAVTTTHESAAFAALYIRIDKEKTMNWNLLRNSTYVLIAGLFLPVLLAASPERCEPGTATSESYTWDFPKEAFSLIEQVQSHAAQVSRNADRLQSLARSNQVSWQSHAGELTEAKQHINEIGELHCRLRLIRHVALPWQQQAIDHMTPKLVNLANSTEAAIQVLNDKQNTLFATNYRDHVAEMYEQADAINDSMGAFLEYADAHQRLEQLELNLPIA